ncbi:hypothetical protein DFS34DRAFT_342383 [Phlyctochytrium arcticum]|nr:hypothetical protein DFS34DRAFT_342383 [Phlyctochytrium arcticum]
MPLILNTLPPPAYSDGTPNFYPSVYKSPRAPAGGYIECEPGRVQKYLDKLSGPLKEFYAAHPEKIPGAEIEAIRRHGGVAFAMDTVLKAFPSSYKMFETKKADLNTIADEEERKRIEKMRADAFIFGHPSGSKYRSTNEFVPHLLWLIEDDTHEHKNCQCKLCSNFLKTGGYAKCYPKGKGASLSAQEQQQQQQLKNPLAAQDSSPTPREDNLPEFPSPPTLPGFSTIAATPASYSPAVQNMINAPSPYQSAAADPHHAYDTTFESNTGENGHLSIPEPANAVEPETTPSQRKQVERYKKKYRELKRKLAEIEDDNGIMEQELGACRKRIGRLRFERSLLYERLQTVHPGDGRLVLEASSRGNASSSSHLPGMALKDSPPPSPSITAGRGSKKARQKKIKLPIDPNAPRRPANAFMLFCDMSREQLKKEREGLGELEIEEKGLGNLTKALGRRWKELGEIDKGRWRALFLDLVQKYDRDMLEYQGGLPEAGQSPAGPSIPDAVHPSVSAAQSDDATRSTAADMEIDDEHHKLDDDVPAGDSLDSPRRDHHQHQHPYEGTSPTSTGQPSSQDAYAPRHIREPAAGEDDGDDDVEEEEDEEQEDEVEEDHEEQSRRFFFGAAGKSSDNKSGTLPSTMRPNVREEDEYDEDTEDGDLSVT